MDFKSKENDSNKVNYLPTSKIIGEGVVGINVKFQVEDLYKIRELTTQMSIALRLDTIKDLSSIEPTTAVQSIANVYRANDTDEKLLIAAALQAFKLLSKIAIVDAKAAAAAEKRLFG